MSLKEERETLILSESDRGTLSKALVAHVYRRRWYVLAVFCYSGIIQATIWNTWGPIAEAANVVLNWNGSNIALLTSLSTLSNIITGLPVCMLMDKKGLRFSLLTCSMMFVVCTGIRCLTLESTPLLWLSYTSSFIFGIASSVPFSGPSLVSAVWFPPHQRTTATALASTFNYLGFALSFLFGPFIVTDPHYSIDTNDYSSNGTAVNATESLTRGNMNATHSRSGIVNNTTVRNVNNIDNLRTGIRALMFTHLGLAVSLLILTLIYFPARPSTPPSYTASIDKPNYREATEAIMKNGKLWLVAIAGGMPLGILGVWTAILDVNLEPIGVTQTEAGWIGFWHTLCGCISALITGRFSDSFMRNRKLFLVVLFVLAAASCLWFTLLYNNYVLFNMTPLYTSAIFLGIFANAAIPLFFETCCEASFPVAEGLTGGFFTFMMNLFGTIFLFLLNIDHIGIKWMNWTVLGTLVASVPLLIAIPEKFTRTNLDIKHSGD